MRPHIRELIYRCGLSLSLKGPIYEFGSYIVEGQEELADLRPIFGDKKYIGIDMRPGPGVDIVLDMAPEFTTDYTRWILPGHPMKTVLMIDTIEHVKFPQTALRNVHYNMAQNSILIMTGPFHFKIHDYPSDYWRFTPAAFESLLEPFDDCLTMQVGNPLFPHTIVGIGLNGKWLKQKQNITQILEEWRAAHE